MLAIGIFVLIISITLVGLLAPCHWAMQDRLNTPPRVLPRKYKSYQEDNNSALHLASYRSDYDSALMLLLANHDKEARNVWGETPLHQCTAQGHLELMMLLLDSGGERRGCGYFRPRPPMRALGCGLVVCFLPIVKDQVGIRY